MAKNKTYLVRVDENLKWTPTKYRKVSVDELDNLVAEYGCKVKYICAGGSEGAITMWAYFKNMIDRGCYSELINAYDLLTNDSKSLVDREHEFREAFNQYRELWAIRYFGSLEAYYLDKAEQAKKTLESYGGDSNA